MKSSTISLGLGVSRRWFLALLVAMGYILVLTTALLKDMSAISVHVGAGKFVVVDSVGTEVGPVIGASVGQHLAVVALQLTTDESDFVAVDVFRTRIGSGQTLLFKSTNCTGQAFRRAANLGPFVAASVNASGDTVLVESGPEQAVAAASELTPSGACVLNSFLFDGVPLDPAFDLTVFIPEFSVVRQ